MKRGGPLKRRTRLRSSSKLETRTRLRRKAMKRKRSAQPAHKRDDAFKAFVRTLRCCAPGPACRRKYVDPHHKHEDGLGMKSHDRTCVPLCRIHHGECEEKRGRFAGYDKQRMRDWHDAESARVLALYAQRTNEAPTSAMEVF